MANLDLTTFTEVDSDGDLTVTSPKVHFSSIRNDATSYVYKDFGAGYFTDFVLDFEVKIDSIDGYNGVIILAGISNTVGTRFDMEDGHDGIVFGALANYGDLTFYLADYNEDNQDNYYYGGAAAADLLYCTFIRLGTNATVNIYSDASRTTLLDALHITCETGAKQHLSAFASGDNLVDPDDNFGGYTQNFNNEVNFSSNANIGVDIESFIVGPHHYDFTTFTEVDSDSDITVTQPKIAFDTMQNGAISYVYKDLGLSDFFSIDFEFKIDSVVGSTGYVTVFAISDTLGTLDDWNVAQDAIHVTAYAWGGSLRFELWDRSTETNVFWVPGGTSCEVMFCTFLRNGTSVEVRFYSDYERTILLDTLNLTCETGAKQYLYALASEGVASSDSMTGFVQYFERDSIFRSEPTITHDLTSDISLAWFLRCNPIIYPVISSDIHQTMDFKSEPDIVSDISDPIIYRGFFPASQADIVFDLISDANAVRNFISQADIVSDTDSDIKPISDFKSQPSIIFDVSSDAFLENLFNSTPLIISDIVSDTGQGGMFRVNPGIISHTRSIGFKTVNFNVASSITFDIINTSSLQSVDFISQADVIFNLISVSDIYVNFAVFPSISWDIPTTSIVKSNIIASQADTTFSILSGSNTELSFASAASVAADTASKIQATREFGAAAELIVFDFQRPEIFREIQFKILVLPSIEISISTQLSVERQFASSPFAMIWTWSDANAERSFVSSPFPMIWTWSDANAERSFTSTASITSSIISRLQRKREFAVNIGIGFSTSEPTLKRYTSFYCSASIDFVTASPNIFKTNYFGSLPEITFNIGDVGAVTERRFTAGPEINWEISDLIPIYVTRNFASSVNIIVNIKSLNIWNLGIESLFPVTVRSLTPKRTVNLI